MSREARGIWPVDRQVTWLRRQGAKASPETGTIALTSEQEAAWPPLLRDAELRRTTGPLGAEGFFVFGPAGKAPLTPSLSRRERERENDLAGVLS